MASILLVRSLVLERRKLGDTEPSSNDVFLCFLTWKLNVYHSLKHYFRPEFKRNRANVIKIVFLLEKIKIQSPPPIPQPPTHPLQPPHSFSHPNHCPTLISPDLVGCPLRSPSLVPISVPNELPKATDHSERLLQKSNWQSHESYHRAPTCRGQGASSFRQP